MSEDEGAKRFKGNVGLDGILNLNILGLNLKDLLGSEGLEELQKKLGDKLSVEYDVKVDHVAKAAVGPEKKIRVLTMTKEQVKEAIEKLDKERRELEETERQLQEEEKK